LKTISRANPSVDLFYKKIVRGGVEKRRKNCLGSPVAKKREGFLGRNETKVLASRGFGLRIIKSSISGTAQRIGGGAHPWEKVEFIVPQCRERVGKEWLTGEF